MKHSIWIRSGLSLLVAGCLAFGQLRAQTPDQAPKGWQLMSMSKDSVYGTSVNRAYRELLKGKTPHRVIVAVLDSGVDTAQQDLQGHIWTNPGEIPGNGIDDDRDGYVDDVHGWNFLGGPHDSSVVKESSELDREYWRLSHLFAGVKDSSGLKKDERADYRLWLSIRSKRESDSSDDARNLRLATMGLNRFAAIDSALKRASGKDTLSVEDLSAFQTDNDTLAMAKDIALRVLENSGGHLTLEHFIQEGWQYVDGLKYNLNLLHQDPNEQRRRIVGDNPFDIRDTHYGNNDVTGTNDLHATHVAGIIAAIRHNHIGMDGITSDVLIMPIRAVPDGDERDKDIALGIRYAVDHGARIINMSFGKPYSPGKRWVDDAVRYADRKGVLLVHAAGNDGVDVDSTADYPSPFYLNDKRAGNFITVGASSFSNLDGGLPASFSNYGKRTVDLFAPGVAIYSTVPHNRYQWLDGTSMATPVVSGIAALLLEYYPHLNPEQLRYILDHSVRPLDSLQVVKPGTKDQMVSFGSLSISGGIVNAYRALQLAARLSRDPRELRRIRKGK